MTFVEAFFGPGNRLSWDAIQAGSLPRDVRDRLGPFLDDLRRNPDVLVLPRVRDNGQVQWYVLCSSPHAERTVRDEVRAFLGPTYSDFDGRSPHLDPNDSVESAVLAHYGTNAFRLDISERAFLDVARERLRLLIRLRQERPTRHARRLRAVGRVLRDFEYALLTGNVSAASDLIDELRSAGHLGATNLLFLDVRRLAASGYQDAILALPEINSLLAMARPRRVTEALIGAVYSSRLKEFEAGQRASEAVERFRSEILPRFGDLYRSRATIAGYEADASFLMAAVVSTPARSDVAEAILANYSADSPQRAYLAALTRLISAPSRLVEVNPLDEARAAFGEADIDRAFELATALSPSFERTALLLRCARDIGTLSAASAALEAVEGMSTQDRARLGRNAILSRIKDSLMELSAATATEAAAPAVAFELPTTWTMWFKRLAASEPWRGAVSVAEIGAREWNLASFARDSAAVQEVADLLLQDRSPWGQEALRDALPYLLDFFLADGVEPRVKAVYENLFLVIAVDDQISLPQVAALLKVVVARLQLGVGVAEYREMIGQLSNAINAVETPSVATIALEAIEVVVNAACPDPTQRQEFVAGITVLFQRWYQRIDDAQFVLLRQLADELGVAHALTQPTAQFDTAAPPLSEWNALDRKSVAMYSLQESALRRAALVVSELCPGARIDTFHDSAGGSPALRTAASTADVFVIATAAAKHAATKFIESHRPKALTTCYARGQGSSSLLEAVRDYVRSSLRETQ